MNEQLTELEIKLTHAEASIEQLNDTVIEQQKRIETLERKVELMQEYIRTMAKNMSQIATQAEETPPPHY